MNTSYKAYNHVDIKDGSRRGNFLIHQCLPNNVDRVVKTPLTFYWYFVKHPLHRRQLVQFINKKWKYEVNTVYVYHYSLPQPLCFDPRWNDAQFLTILRVLIQKILLDDPYIPIPHFFEKEVNKSIDPF